jgi:hypothetical protein
MYAFEWTPWHTATLCAWVVCVAITGTVYALTRNKAALHVLAALFLPLAGALWLHSMLSRDERDPPNTLPDPAQTPAPAPPPVRIDHKREEALDDLLEEDNTVRDDPPDDLGAALDAWARSGEDG